MITLNREKLVSELQANICRLEGFKSFNSLGLDKGLGPIKNAFPNSTFPLGAVHEFLLEQNEGLATTSGFVVAILSQVIKSKGAVVWISTSRKLFPPALKSFGLDPDQFIFVDLRKEKDVAWATEEALKCEAISAVVGEMKEIDFTTSRRLQLAVEKSQVTGFILRSNRRNLSTTACVSRWKITSLPSESIKELPGIGFPKWKVELLRARNGRPGSWDVQWIEGRFDFGHSKSEYPLQIIRKDRIPTIKQAG